MSDGTFPLFVALLLLGIGLGTLAANFVIDQNVEYYQGKHQKQLVELGVGSYDSRTGAFQIKACAK